MLPTRFSELWLRTTPCRLLASMLCCMLPALARPALAADEAIPVYKRADLPVEQRVTDLLSRMTLQEKARQLDLYRGIELVDKRRAENHAALDARFDTNLAASKWGALGAGGIHDLYPSAALANEIQSWVISNSRLGIPALFIEEGLHGYMDFNQTVFPESINLGATFDTSLALRTATAIASEARAHNVHMILGPVLCLARDPRWGRVEETFGEDTYLTGQMGLNYVLGLQGDSLNSDHTVVAEPKHFAAHGSPESGRNTATVHIGERELRMIMLKGFEPAIRQGKAMAVMAAYHNIDGIPCVSNPLLLTQVLRREWGFNGFVLSDLGATRMLFDTQHVATTPRDAICMALSAGLDMQFYDFDHDVYQSAIIDAVNEGQLPVAVVDRAAGDVLRVKFELGLFDHPSIDPQLAKDVCHSQPHQDLALESAQESMCLLKNENNLLPLSRDLKTVAVIGPNALIAQLGDYSDVAKRKYRPMLDEIRARVSPQTNVIFNNGKDIRAAVEALKNADVAILGLGERPGISGESFDRSNLDLPDQQEQLLEAVAGTGVPVVLVLQNGRPLTITWAAAHVGAILEAWYPGERGGEAIAMTLFGENNPAGRLPVSFPKSVGQLPVYYNRDSSVGGSYVDGDLNPLFPFGFGLSYTTFEYSEPAVNPAVAKDGQTVTVSVDVTNTGSREGQEVVQLYIRKPTSSVVTPAKALKGFARVDLKPAQSKTVSFQLSPDELEIWNVQQQWAVEKGEYEATIGGSSAGGKTVSFKIAG